MTSNDLPQPGRKRAGIMAGYDYKGRAQRRENTARRVLDLQREVDVQRRRAELAEARVASLEKLTGVPVKPLAPVPKDPEARRTQLFDEVYGPALQRRRAGVNA